MATRRRNSVNAVARKALALKGLDDLNQQLAKMVDEATGKELKDALMSGAIPLRDEAKRIAPMKTGRLRSAIFADRGDENRPSVLVGVNYKIAPHAHVVEFGHAGPSPAPPKPYMRPAAANTSATVYGNIRKGFGKIIAKYR